MAKVTIELSDMEDGSLRFRAVFDPPLKSGDIENATVAQALGAIVVSDTQDLLRDASTSEEDLSTPAEHKPADVSN